jgi:hypothetical protein
MLVVLLAVAFVDVAFAVDSIPAIFAVTTDPFLVFTSNAFAVLGMRAMFFLLAGVMDRFVHLKVGLAAVLALVGVKMLVADLYEVPVWASLAAIVAILGVSIVVSLRSGSTPSEIEGATDEGVPGVDRPERAADRGDGGGRGPVAGGRGDGGDAGTRAGRDHPRPRGAGDRVRVGAAGAREGPGPGEANG